MDIVRSSVTANWIPAGQSVGRRAYGSCRVQALRRKRIGTQEQLGADQFVVGRRGGVAVPSTAGGEGMGVGRKAGIFWVLRPPRVHTQCGLGRACADRRRRESRPSPRTANSNILIDVEERNGETDPLSAALWS